MNRKYWDMLSGIGFMTLSVVLFIGSRLVKSNNVSRYGAGFFPAIVAGLMFIAATVIVITGIRKAKGPDEDAPKDEDKPRTIGVLATFGIMAAYALFLPLAGFLITTSVYLFAQILLLAPKSKRNYFLISTISVVTSVAVYFLFVKVFSLMLPSGILG